MEQLVDKSLLISAIQCEKKLYLASSRLEQFNALKNNKRQSIEAQELKFNSLSGLCPQISHSKSAVELNATNSTQYAERLRLEGGISNMVLKHDNAEVALDLIVKNKLGKNNLAIIKLSSGFKRHYHFEAAMAYVLAKELGLNPNRFFIYIINKKYKFNNDVDYKKLLVKIDVTLSVRRLSAQVVEGIQKANLALKDPGQQPLIEVGEHCKLPLKCVFMEVCNPDAVKHNTQQDEINPILEIQNPEAISNYLSEFKSPVYSLDFETLSIAIPPFKGLKPFEQIPFSFASTEIASSIETARTKVFFPDDCTQFLEPLAQELINMYTPNRGILCFGKNLEERALRLLANEFPNWKKQFLEMADNLIDLEYIFKKQWIKVDPNGKKSNLKFVVKAFNLPYFNAKKSSVNSGYEAGMAIRRLYSEKGTKEELAYTRHQLMAYSEADGKAISHLWFEILKLVPMKKGH